MFKIIIFIFIYEISCNICWSFKGQLFNLWNLLLIKSNTLFIQIIKLKLFNITDNKKVIKDLLESFLIENWYN
jgi:hypothetical protein